jgi:hypothetical protein
MMNERGAWPVEVDREGRAYRSGWQDGRFGETGTFAANANLAAWENLDRVAYYRGHREGRLVRDMLRVSMEVAETA